MVMVADKRKFCSCIVVLKSKPDMNEADQQISTNELFGPAKDVDAACATVRDALGDKYNGTEKWNAAILAGIQKYNKNPVSQAAKINAFKICRDGFSVGNGLCTDTMKLKRSKVYTKHGPLIEFMYAESNLAMAKSALKKAAEEEKEDCEKELKEAEEAFAEAEAILEKEYCPTGSSATDF